MVEVSKDEPIGEAGSRVVAVEIPIQSTLAPLVVNRVNVMTRFSQQSLRDGNIAGTLYSYIEVHGQRISLQTAG